MALAGIIGFWAMPAPAPAVVSLLLSGLGVALLYPVIVAQALDVWTARPERAAARCTLASGVAIGAGPLLLGVLADTAGLRTAMLLAPLLLVFLLVRGVQRLGGRQRPA
jgi:fucose permease